MHQYFMGIIFLLLFALPGQGQKIPGHSLAMGIKNGAATVSFRELNTAHVGLAMDHQRNFGPVFSLRSALHFSYMLPVKYVRQLPYDHTLFAQISKRTSEYSFFQASFRLMPCFYHRDDRFNLYLGLAAGLGTLTEIYQRYDEYFNYPEMGEFSEKKGDHRQRTKLNIGYSPVFGCGFLLGNRGEGGEIELSLAYENWSRVVVDGKFNEVLGYTGFSLQTTYRYNFKN